MEKDDFNVVVSENSARNLEEVKTRQEIDKFFRHGRSDVVIFHHDKKHHARSKRWLAEARIKDNEENSSRYDLFLEMTASKALEGFKQNEIKASQFIADKKSKSQKKKEERISSDYLHHPQTRMGIFFKNAPNMCMSEHVSVSEGDDNDFESLPNESGSVISEFFRLESDRDAALLRADNTAETCTVEDPYIQRADVFERMWMHVEEDDPVWKVYCTVLLNILVDARKNHQQVSACMNCATIFIPFFPDDYHMHQRSAEFKTCIGSRSAGAKWEILAQKALIKLAKEAKAYRKIGGDEYIKLIRIVKGTRGHRTNVKYNRIELCQNSNVESCESVSEKKFQSRNLTVGILKLVIQLHFKIPIPKWMVRPYHHGAGLYDYFERYRHFVPEFKNNIMFRCFLIEFGQHVRRTDRFDPGYELRSNWWCGSYQSNFVGSGLVGVIVQLDKRGLVQLAKSLVDGTFKVLEDFYESDKNEVFLKQKDIAEDNSLQEYLDEIPAWVEKEKLENEKGRVPVLRPLEIVTNPETHNIEKNKKTSQTMISKRPPNLTEEDFNRREQLRIRKQKSRARQKQEDNTVVFIY